jgi:hypothetical protein
MRRGRRVFRSPGDPPRIADSIHLLTAATISPQSRRGTGSSKAPPGCQPSTEPPPRRSISRTGAVGRRSRRAARHGVDLCADRWHRGLSFAYRVPAAVTPYTGPARLSRRTNQQDVSNLMILCHTPFELMLHSSRRSWVLLCNNIFRSSGECAQ